MSYSGALGARKRAVVQCRASRAGLDAAVDEMLGAYRARPLPVLASAAGIGFVFARLKVGTRLVDAGAQLASGPAWRLLRQYLFTVA